MKLVSADALLACDLRYAQAFEYLLNNTALLYDCPVNPLRTELPLPCDQIHRDIVDDLRPPRNSFQAAYVE